MMQSHLIGKVPLFWSRRSRRARVRLAPLLPPGAAQLPDRLTADSHWLAAAAPVPARGAAIPPPLPVPPPLPGAAPADPAAPPRDAPPRDGGGGDGAAPGGSAGGSVPLPRLVQIACLAGLVVLADGLLFDAGPGIGLPLFLAALFAAALLANPLAAAPHDRAFAIAVLALCLAPLVMDPTPLALAIGFGGTAAALLLAAYAPARTLPALLGDAAVLIARAAFQPFADGFRVLEWFAGPGHRRLRADLLGWIVPAVLGLLFLALFASANPLIDRWVGYLDPEAWLAWVTPERFGLWLVTALVAWPFVLLAGRPAFRLATGPLPHVAGVDQLLGAPAILRSLVLFNGLFALETALDIAYLWGGLDLPEGMTFAGYAHRGAYPLVVTALLAAAFVLAALRRGSEAARSRVVRALLLLFVAQNILLVFSAMLRLDLYVDAYSLTYWRVAAFVWMALVAIGLGLILVRILRDLGNGWLVGANLKALVAVLWTVALLNWPHLIARFNVEHALARQDTAAPLDLGYLVGLGPQAIPAIDRYQAARRAGPSSALAASRARLASEHRLAARDWRSWSLAGARLSRYLDATP
jgi:hypothetical protein